MTKLKHPKAKGTRFENQVVDFFKKKGYPAERCWGSNGESRGLPKEVDIIVNDLKEYSFDSLGCEYIENYQKPLYIQCKSVAKLAAKFIPNESIHATMYRENRGKIYIMFELEEFTKRFL